MCILQKILKLNKDIYLFLAFLEISQAEKEAISNSTYVRRRRRVVWNVDWPERSADEQRIASR